MEQRCVALLIALHYSIRRRRRKALKATLTPKSSHKHEKYPKGRELSLRAAPRSMRPIPKNMSPKRQIPILCTRVAFGEPLQIRASTLRLFRSTSGQRIFFCLALISSLSRRSRPVCERWCDMVKRFRQCAREAPTFMKSHRRVVSPPSTISAAPFPTGSIDPPTGPAPVFVEFEFGFQMGPDPPPWLGGSEGLFGRWPHRKGFSTAKNGARMHVNKGGRVACGGGWGVVQHGVLHGVQIGGPPAMMTTGGGFRGNVAGQVLLRKHDVLVGSVVVGSLDGELVVDWTFGVPPPSPGSPPMPIDGTTTVGEGAEGAALPPPSSLPGPPSSMWIPYAQYISHPSPLLLPPSHWRS